MNLIKLKNAEKIFLTKYPGGFEHPEMQVIAKKHKPEKMHEKAITFFAPDQFEDTDDLLERMIKLVSASSMVSVFEKPKFRDFIRSSGGAEREGMVKALYERLHGDAETGFEMLADILSLEKLAKWTLVSVIPAYYSPDFEVFIKPTTIKGIIRFLEIQDIVYKPSPTWDFYTRYRKIINSIKCEVSPSLKSQNSAFSGFLMMCMEGL